MIKRCSKCVLPETIPNISFNEEGVCNYCIEYERNRQKVTIDYEQKKKKFDSLIEEARNKRLRNGYKYDVLVPLSGGRDSSYVALELSQRNLKILCVNYDNPFSSNQARINIKKLTESIHADLITFRCPKNRHEKSFKTNLKAWLKKPELATMGLMCLACKPMYLEFFKIAKKNNITLIVDGSNPSEGTTFKRESQAGRGAKKLFSIKSIMNIMRKSIKNFSYIRPCNFIPAINTLLSLNGDTPYLRWKYSNILKIGYFYFHKYNEKEIEDALKKIGWEKARDNKSPWRFDCEIDSLKNYLFQKLISATEKDDLFSKNIRAGLMTRKEAIDRLEEGEVNPEIVRRVLKKINMNFSDIRDLNF